MPGFRADGRVGPLCNKPCNETLLSRLIKAFWPVVEGGMWVAGFGADGGVGPFCNERCNETMLL